MTPPVPTNLDVAAAADVSSATVSRMLSAPEKVTEATRRRVLKAIRQFGYSPNAAAKSLRTLTTRRLLVTIPDIANPFFSFTVIQGIEEAALRGNMRWCSATPISNQRAGSGTRRCCYRMKPTD